MTTRYSNYEDAVVTSLTLGNLPTNAAGNAQIPGPASHVTTVTFTPAQAAAFKATPKTLVAAPGANLAVVIKYIIIEKKAGTAYTINATSNNFMFSYTNASGQEVAGRLYTTGFMDQTTDVAAIVSGTVTNTVGTTSPALCSLTANAPVVVSTLVTDLTAGTGNVTFTIVYDIVPTVLS